MPYRGRLAPTPSGVMHLGHAQTFYIAWKRAQEFEGQLILRIEDLDKVRCRPQYLDQMIDDLQWFGLNWQEGPQIKQCGANNSLIESSSGPFEQSKRMDFYLAAWLALYRGGFIYPSTHSRKEISQLSISAPHEEGNISAEPIFPLVCRLPESQIPKDLVHPGNCNWRFRVPDGQTISFVDLRCGQQNFVAGKDFGDFLVWRADGFPSYELAVVVDDRHMGITEVVRGEDLLLSTSRQLLLYEALGWASEVPSFYHCPLVRDENGLRMAKRASPVATISKLRSDGWTPERIRTELLPTLESL
jgi:glutamyl/glutaminyl-tRNA synthetase